MERTLNRVIPDHLIVRREVLREYLTHPTNEHASDALDIIKAISDSPEHISEVTAILDKSDPHKPIVPNSSSGILRRYVDKAIVYNDIKKDVLTAVEEYFNDPKSPYKINMPHPATTIKHTGLSPLRIYSQAPLICRQLYNLSKTLKDKSLEDGRNAFVQIINFSSLDVEFKSYSVKYVDRYNTGELEQLINRTTNILLDGGARCQDDESSLVAGGDNINMAWVILKHNVSTINLYLDILRDSSEPTTDRTYLTLFNLLSLVDAVSMKLDMYKDIDSGKPLTIDTLTQLERALIYGNIDKVLSRDDVTCVGIDISEYIFCCSD